MVIVFVQLQYDSDSGGCCGSDRQMAQLGAAEGSGHRFAELWVGQVQALLDLELTGDFLPKSPVPQGGQLWTSSAAA